MHLFKLVFFFSDIYIGVGVLAHMINSVIAEKAFETIQQQFMIIKKNTISYISDLLTKAISLFLMYILWKSL